MTKSAADFPVGSTVWVAGYCGRVYRVTVLEQCGDRVRFDDGICQPWDFPRRFVFSRREDADAYVDATCSVSKR